MLEREDFKRKQQANVHGHIMVIGILSFFICMPV
jgi:hypothetical protein